MAVSKSNSKFIADVTKWVNITDSTMMVVKKQVAKEMFRRVINRTPLWREGDPAHPQGKTKGNWSASNGRPTEKKLARIDPSGQTTLAAMEKVVDRALAGKSVYLSNSSDHIFVLEDGKYPIGGKGSWDKVTREYEKRSTGGWSNQLLSFGPAGMVKVTVSEFEDIVNMVTRKFKVRVF